MAERAPRSPETKTHSAENSRKHSGEKAHHKHEQATRPSAEHARSKVHEQAKSSHNTLADLHGDTEAHTPTYSNATLRRHAFNNTMRSVRSRLSPVERSFSNVVHNPVVDKVSEASGKTIGRPSGILGGSLAALIGTSFVLFLARRNGFETRPSLFLVLFAGGFAVGVALEFFFYMIRLSRSKS